MRPGDLNELLSHLSAAEQEIVLALRDMALRAVPQAVESILWGGLSYHRPEIGGRVKGAVCQITAKHGQVRLEFIHGVRLADPLGLLQGDRLSKRFVRIDSVADAQRPVLVKLIQEAAELDPTTWT